MRSKARLLGHAIHPILVMFPLGMLLSGLIFDLIAVFTKKRQLAHVAYWNITGGLLGGLIAAIPGIVDWLAIPAESRAKNVGARHALGNLVFMGMFAGSWLQRRENPDELPGTGSLLLEVAGGAAAGVSGWLGGELVERLAVGVTPGAHLDAPSSLTHETLDPHEQATAGH